MGRGKRSRQSKEGYANRYRALTETKCDREVENITLEDLPSILVDGERKRCKGVNPAATSPTEPEDTPGFEGNIADRTHEDGSEEPQKVSEGANPLTYEQRSDVVRTEHEENMTSGADVHQSTAGLTVSAITPIYSDAPRVPFPNITPHPPAQSPPPCIRPKATRRVPKPTIFPLKVKDTDPYVAQMNPYRADLTSPDPTKRDLRQKVLNRAFFMSQKAVLGDQPDQCPIEINEIPLETFNTRPKSGRHGVRSDQSRVVAGLEFQQTDRVQQQALSQARRFTKAPRPPRQPLYADTHALLRQKHARSYYDASMDKRFLDIHLDAQITHDAASDDVRHVLPRIPQMRIVAMPSSGQQTEFALPAIAPVQERERGLNIAPEESNRLAAANDFSVLPTPPRSPPGLPVLYNQRKIRPLAAGPRRHPTSHADGNGRSSPEGQNSS